MRHYITAIPLLLAVTLTSLSLLTQLHHAQAQVSPPIISSGLNTHVSGPITVDGKTQFNVTGGTRPGGGTNLFHSFGEFNVPTNMIANFHNDSNLPTSNILARVTGGNFSNINGLIQTSEFGTANLFLMNPAGFVFGPNASIHVGGAVHFTTADYLRLSDNHRFNTVPSPVADALLTTSDVAAFGFLTPQPLGITVQGSHLTAAKGSVISLVGGNLQIQSVVLPDGTIQRAHLSVPNGKIQLTSSNSPGEFDTTLQPLQVEGTSFQSFTSIILAPNSTIDVQGANTVSIRDSQFILSVKDARLTTSQNGGPLNTISLDQSTITNLASNGTQPGNILLKADIVRLNNSIISTDRGGVFTSTAENPRPGDIKIESNIFQSESSLIASGTPLPGSSGNGGTITLNIKEAANLTDTLITSQTIGQGHAGTINIAAKNLTLIDSYLTTTTGDSVDIGSVATGNAGGINLAVNTLTMRDSLLDSRSLFSAGKAGTVAIRALEFISMIGSGDLSFGVTTATAGAPEFCSGLCGGNGGKITVQSPSITLDQVGLSSSTTGMGNAGDILIETQNLKILNGAQITASAEGSVATGAGGTVTIQGLTGLAPSIIFDGRGSGIFTNTEGTGVGGNINVVSKSMLLQNGSAISAETSGQSQDAKGGSIIIIATDQVTLTDGASIEASSIGLGDAGNISIHAGQRFMIHNGLVTTSASQAAGGDIEIKASDFVSLVNGRISTSVLGGSGNGGNISIDPNMVVLQNNSQIVANALTGHGGNITIATPLFLADQSSLVNASSQFGLNGTVTIQSPVSNLSGTVGQLTSQPSPVHLLVQNRCVALANGQPSTLIVGGRQTFSTTPGGWASSPTLMAIGTGEPVGVRSEERTIGLPAASENDVLSLRHVTPPSFLVRSFANDVHTGCRL